MRRDLEDRHLQRWRRPEVDRDGAPQEALGTVDLDQRQEATALGLGEVSLAEARDKADEIRRAATNGIDLVLQRTNNKARTVSFRQAFETYFALKRKQLSNAKHLQQWPSTMETYVFPVFGNVPIADVDGTSSDRGPRSNLVRQAGDGETYPPAYGGCFQVRDSARRTREGFPLHRRCAGISHAITRGPAPRRPSLARGSLLCHDASAIAAAGLAKHEISI